MIRVIAALNNFLQEDKTASTSASPEEAKKEAERKASEAASEEIEEAKVRRRFQNVLTQSIVIFLVPGSRSGGRSCKDSNPKCDSKWTSD
jgi:hypothetical protein